jgi:hypothetical protein
MHSRHSVGGCTLSCGVMVAVRGLSVRAGNESRGKRTTSFTSWVILVPAFLGVLLEYKGKWPTSLREGERHLVVIVTSDVLK